MAFLPDDTARIPSARVPFIDPKTGLVSREWYRYLELVNNMRTTDFYFDVSQGIYTGKYDGINTTGYQDTNTLNVQADLWPINGNLTWITTATALEVLSSSANDTAAGTGARTVTITGLDNSYNVISETISLNGVAAVQSTKTYFRLSRAFVSSTGTNNGTNLGTITIRITGGGATQGVLPIGFGRMPKSHHTVPIGKKYAIRDITVISESTKPTEFRVYIRDSTIRIAPFGTKQVGLVYAGIVGAFEEHLTHEVVLGTGTDIWMTATPSASNTKVSCSIQGVLIAA